MKNYYLEKPFAGFLCIFIISIIFSLLLQKQIFAGQQEPTIANINRDLTSSSAGLFIDQKINGSYNNIFIANGNIVFQNSPLDSVKNLIKPKDDPTSIKVKLQKNVRLDKKNSKIAAQLEMKIKQGDHKEAEAILLKERARLTSENQKRKAKIDFELGAVNELQFDFGSARQYYQKAVSADQENSTYLSALGAVLVMVGNYQEAITYLQKAIKIDKGKNGEMYPDVIKNYALLGSAFVQTEDIDNARKYLLKARELTISRYRKNHPNLVLVYTGLATISERQGNIRETLRLMIAEFDILLECLSGKSPYCSLDKKTKSHKKEIEDIVRRYLHILKQAYEKPDLDFGSWKLYTKEHRNEVIDLSVEMIDLLADIYGVTYPLIAKNILIAKKYVDLKDYDKASDYYLKALKMTKEHFGEKSITYCEIYYDLGSVAVRFKQNTKAIEYYTNALSVCQQLPDFEQKNIFYLKAQIAELLFAAENFHEAAKYSAEAVEMAEKVVGENDPSTANVYNMMTLIWFKLDEPTKAYDTARKALAIRQKYQNYPDRYLVAAYTNYALALYNLNKCEESLDYYSNALKMSLTINGESHFETAKIYTNFAHALAKTEHYNKAIEYYRNAIAILQYMPIADYLGKDDLINDIRKEIEWSQKKLGGL